MAPQRGIASTDFAPPYRRGPIPHEAREAELVVGAFETERLMGGVWTPADLREHSRQYAASGRAVHSGAG
jgi:hypothetical protein